MALPNELILDVCQHLPKLDLKACRLVSKVWSQFASEYLFDKVYISPRKEDIEVFNLITQHSQLRHCVKRLEYDGTRFSPSYSKNEYICRLFEQARGYSDFYRTNFNSTDLQYTQFIKSCLEASATVATIVNESSSHAFVLEGQIAWRDRHEYQRRVLENGEFLQTLTRGLNGLDFLNAVEVRNNWHAYTLSDDWRKWSPTVITKDLQHSEPYFYGSPFGRVWGLSHPRPRSWFQSDPHNGAFVEGPEAFQTITTALSQSQRNIRSFQSATLPVSMFDSNITGTLIDLSTNAYSGLEDLHLDLHETVELMEVSVGLRGLQALLGSMGGLKRLCLSLPHDEWGEKAIFKCSQVFPTNGTQWMKLNKLYIRVLLTSAKDLVNILITKMPNLRELTFEEVELLEGRWEGVIEFLKTSMKLLSFPLNKYLWLRHLEGEKFLNVSGDHQETDVFCTNLEKYVVSGGRHPCLHADEDTSASSKYLLDLDL